MEDLVGSLAEGPDDDGHGFASLINPKELTFERLPALETAFERLRQRLTLTLKNLLSQDVDVKIESLRAQRFGDYMISLSSPSVISMFRAIEWNGSGLVSIDSPMICSVVDILLGGRRAGVPVRIEGRSCTTIEFRLAERMIRLALDDLGQAFAPLTSVRFRLEQTEGSPRSIAISRPGGISVVLRLRVDTEDRGGAIEFLIPYATLEPVRDLLRAYLGERLGHDSAWENHLTREVQRAEIDLEAVLEERTVGLAEILELRAGSVVRLSARPDSAVRLRCGQVPVLSGRVGRVGDRIVVKVEERIDRGKEV